MDIILEQTSIFLLRNLGHIRCDTFVLLNSARLVLVGWPLDLLPPAGCFRDKLADVHLSGLCNPIMSVSKQ